jgi:hypothetical protein
MNGLQKILENSLTGVPKMLFAEMLREKLLEQGVKITPRRAEIITAQILAGKPKISIPGKVTGEIKLLLTSEDAEALNLSINKFLETHVPDLIRKLQADMTPPMLESLRKRWPKERRIHQRTLADFRKRLHQRWSRGLDKLGMLIYMARDFGNEMNREVRAKQKTENADLVDVITRLHARSCQVAEEVVVLLENGFANGAMARWRTMHEIAVTANFIGKHGNACAHLYKEHQVVESYRAAKEYDMLHARLGYEPIAAEERDKIDKQYAHAIQQYGQHFGGQYGWAAADLQMKKPTFKELESHVGTDFLRGHYRMASHGVHANPKGIFFNMGSLFPSDILAAGPSNSGLADAGDGAARSLLSISSSLLYLSQSLDYQVALKVMTILVNEIGTAFLNAHKKLYNDEVKLREEEVAAKALLAEHGITKEDIDDFKIVLKTPKGVGAASQRAHRTPQAKRSSIKHKAYKVPKEP